MENTGAETPSFLDRALLTAMRLDGEKLAWAVLLIVAVLSRTMGLGDRAMSHDESLHAVYSWQLYDGRGFQHQPMMHGPLKFILDAGMFFLFGVNDWSARIQVALFGILMIWLVWLMRPWLGKTGAFLTALMFTISPALLYHSRYIRDEVMLCALLILMIVAIFRYLETRALKWLIWTAVALGLAFTTMEASFIFGALFGIFLVLALVAQLWAADWPPAASGRRSSFRVLGLVAIAGVATGAVAIIFKANLIGLVLVGVGVAAAAVALVLVAASWRMKVRVFAELDLIVLLITLVLPFTSALIMQALGWKIAQFNNPGQVTLAMVWQGIAVLVAMFIVSGVVGWLWLRTRWLIAAGIFWAIELLLFTTLLTNGQGIGTGLIGSLGYWIEQQNVMRGGQPWYYFWMEVPLYEFLPLLLSLGGIVTWLVRCFRRPAPDSAESSEAAAVPARTVGESKKSEGSRPVSAAAPGGKSAEWEPAAPFGVQPQFEAFMVFWVVSTWAVFTYVGEKMPWHVVYFATSMSVLGGWWLGKVIDGIDWRAGRKRGIFWLMGMVPLFLVVLKALLPTSTKRPFADVSVNGLSNSAQWLMALVVGLVLIYFIYDRIVALGGRQGLRIIATSLAAMLFVGTAAVSYRFVFVNYDYATEPMVYAHGTPDIKLAMRQIEEISRKTVGDHALKVAYDDDSTWPLEWYLRDYPNKAYFGANPNRAALDAPVVVVGDKNVSKVKPYLGDNYYQFDYRLVWWPRETYKGLNWQRIRDGLLDPKQRGQIWDIILHRRYATPTSQWDPVHRFTVYVKKDVASQVWDWGATTATKTAEAAKNPYEGGQRQVAALQQIGSAGVPGTTTGQFKFPRSVAVDDSGRIYVADSGNNRVQVFNPDGSFLQEWGSTCKLDTKEGCQGEGQGQFNEPWGIVVGKDGSVYVSDTWNHRVQKFDNTGKFVTSWGVFESTGGELGKPAAFYGPRALALGQDGNISVMDTGNKRVQVFAPDGTFVAQYGGGGVVEGRFDEPTGVGQDAAGNWYVADAWNHRIQKFDKDHNYVSQWPVDGWASQSVVNKPALAVDPVRNIVYVTDPENYRILAFNTDGTFKATFGMYGNDDQSFSLPTGIAVGKDGRVYVADGDGQRIMVFPPLQ